MYVANTMNLEGREKLAKLLETLVEKHKSRRALARNLGISHTTIIGWENMTSFPDMDNLIKIAREAGYSLHELQEMLEGKKDRSPKTSVDRVIYEIQQLSRRDIARVIEASARFMVKAEYGEA